jgi:hypothetical protein
VSSITPHPRLDVLSHRIARAFVKVNARRRGDETSPRNPPQDDPADPRRHSASRFSRESRESLERVTINVRRSVSRRDALARRAHASTRARGEHSFNAELSRARGPSS